METATANNALPSTAIADNAVTPTATADNAATPTATADNAATPTATASKAVIPTAAASKAVVLKSTTTKAVVLKPRKSRAKPKDQHKKRGWSTTEQNTFLDQYMPRYIKAQATRKFDEFWLTVENDFNEKWKPKDIPERKKVRTITSRADCNETDSWPSICAIGLIIKPAEHPPKSMSTCLTSKCQTSESYDTITKRIPSCITRIVYKTKPKLPGRMLLRTSRAGSWR